MVTTAKVSLRGIWCWLPRGFNWQPGAHCFLSFVWACYYCSAMYFSGHFFSSLCDFSSFISQCCLVTASLLPSALSITLLPYFVFLNLLTSFLSLSYMWPFFLSIKHTVLPQLAHSWTQYSYPKVNTTHILRIWLGNQAMLLHRENP